MSKKQSVTNDIKVPQNDLNVLKQHFSDCFDKQGNFRLDKFTQKLDEKNIQFYKESYALDWLGKSYARLLASDPATTLLKADEAHNRKTENEHSQHVLLKGDNLEVLKHLANAYYEKVKMIYIDPPYNTGSDGFVYQDDRKFTAGELATLAGIDREKAQRILDFTRSSSNSHSAWLTFMYPRLYIAKQLLKDDGVLFVSIDDNEVAQLRLLLDEVFGEENFVASLIWRRRKTQANLSKYFAPVHDYILCFSKNITKLVINKIGYKDDFIKKTFSNPDNDHRGVYQTAPLARPDNSSNKEYTLIMPNGRKITAKWSCSQQTFDTYVKENRLVIPRDGEGMPRIKVFLADLGGQIPNTWLDSIATNDEASKEIEILFGSNAFFSFPKPSKLMKYLIEIGSASTDIILDFFAGSGTTGDAVMQLNAEDGGARKFILVQLPEAIDAKKSSVAYHFVKEELGVSEPTIFEITKERLIRAAKKVQEQLDSKVASLEEKIRIMEGKLDINEEAEQLEQLKLTVQGLQNQDLGFKVFETVPIWEDYDFEAEQFDASQTLFDEGKLTEEDLKALLVTWKTYDGIPLTNDLVLVHLGDYLAHYGEGKLYLMSKGFSTDTLKEMLEKIDSDKQFNPRSVIAFGYHFDSKNLRELSENVKSYANKKNIDIDFITRY